MRARTLYRLNAGLLLGFAAGSIALWDRVPERLPLHFGFTGSPDIWVTKSVVSWLGLPVLAVAVSAFLYAVHRAGRPYPRTWDVPEKEVFLRLPPEDQAAVREMMDRAVAWTMLLLTLMMIGAQVAVYLVAAGRATEIPWYVTAVEVGGIAGILGGALVYRRRARRYIRSRAHAADGRGEHP